MHRRDEDGEQRGRERKKEREKERDVSKEIRYGLVKRKKETREKRKSAMPFVLNRCERERSTGGSTSGGERRNFSAVWRSEF